MSAWRKGVCNEDCGPPALSSMLSWPSRTVSSYCTDDCVDALSVSGDLDAINAFSTTSYYVSREGLLTECNPSYPACNWTSMGSVDVFNAAVQATTGARAQPLVFSNSGDMTVAFRALVSRSGGVAEAAAFLADKAAAFNYTRVQLDLEPSCWAASPSDCGWPTSADADAYIALVNASADALRKVGSGVGVCVGNWPQGQCSPANYTACEAAGDGYAEQCATGQWDMGACNCCAYMRFYALEQLCASRADLIVNMDTYQDAPFNVSVRCPPPHHARIPSHPSCEVEACT